MALRDGWYITTDEGGEPLIYALINGSACLVKLDPDAEGDDALIHFLEPGYYDTDLNPVPEDEATAPEPEKP